MCWRPWVSLLLWCIADIVVIIFLKLGPASISVLRVDPVAKRGLTGSLLYPPLVLSQKYSEPNGTDCLGAQIDDAEVAESTQVEF